MAFSESGVRHHIVIPDTQVKPGVDTTHLSWIGNYIVDEFAGDNGIAVIHLGDHWDMPSLSSYDKGKKAMEGRRYLADIDAGNEGFARLCEPLESYNANKAATKHAQWWPERHFLDGNHENRVTRAGESDPSLDGILSLDSMNARGWTRHPFLEPVDIDGVVYAHYFYNPMSGRPYSGMIETRLRQIGHSFTQGHQQTLAHGVRFVKDQAQHGLVCGACYLHTEDYKGPQGNAHWRGIIVCHEVDDGHYDPMFVSLNYLCRRYEGITLAEYMLATVAA